MSTRRRNKYPGSPPPRSPNTVITHGRTANPGTTSTSARPGSNTETAQSSQSQNATLGNKQASELNKPPSPTTSTRETTGSEHAMQEVPLWGEYYTI